VKPHCLLDLIADGVKKIPDLTDPGFFAAVVDAVF